MAIIFECACGTEIQALDGQAGRKVKCPACRSELTVPRRSAKWKPEPVPDLGIVVTDVPAISEPPRRSRASVRRAVIRNAVVGLLIWTGSLFLTVLAWRLFFAPSRRPGPPTVIDHGGAVEIPAGQDEAVDTFERDRLEAMERARREEAEELARRGRVQAPVGRP